MRPVNPRPAPKAPATTDQAADRLDALLEQRFASGNREAMARQLAEHDRHKPAAPLAQGKLIAPARTVPVDRGKIRIRFTGAIPPKLQDLLKEWLPGLFEYGTRLGLSFTAAGVEFHVHDRATYEAAHGAIPKSVTLPASSYHFNALYRHYIVRLVLPPNVESLEQLLAVLRTALTRLYGDVFLHEEIYGLAPYKEDEPVEGPSVGLAEQIQVLSQLEATPPELEKALAGFASAQGLNYKRAPGSVRKAFFGDLEHRTERDDVPPVTLALLDGLFQGYLKGLQADLPKAVGDQIAQAEALNRQLTFLPPHEWPHYTQLKETRPVHYLRAAKLRLEFTIEALAALLEDFDALAEVARTPSPLVEERVQGFLQTLEAQRLARSYLVPNARLSDELQSKLGAFPLEVHEILLRLPRMEDANRQFESLSQRIRTSLHQRLYHAFVLLRHALRNREAGKTDAFQASPSYAALKAHAANFRLRLPMLRGLFARLGVVVDLAEASHAELNPAAGRVRFPQQAFTRAWGQFAAHTVVAGWLAERKQKGFDAARYTAQVDAGLKEGLGQAQARLVYLLRQYHVRTGAPDLAELVHLLKGPSGTFRFALAQAAQNQAAPAPKAGADSPLAALEEILTALLLARQDQIRHALVVGPDGKLR
jgi:hypothetical protein